MQNCREWLKKHIILICGVVVALLIGSFACLAVSHTEPNAADKAIVYATTVTCGSLPVTQFTDAEAEVKIRWKDGVMGYDLSLNDQSGAMAKWISAHPKGDFYIDWLNADETSFARVTAPFNRFQGKGSNLNAIGQFACDQEFYRKVFERNAYWGLSWNTHDR